MRTTDRCLNFLGLRPTGDLGGLTCYTNRRGNTVWFVKSPPTSPASDAQRRQRNRFRTAAMSWRAIAQTTRDTWNLAGRLAGLRIHGYNLYVYWQLTRDRACLQTIERQSGCSLLPPPI